MSTPAENQSADDSLPEEVRSAIGIAPALVFLLVAGADGNIDRKELKTFQKLISGKDYAVLLAMMQQSGASPVETIQQILSSGRNPVEYLATISQALDQSLPAESAHGVKIMLLAFAKAIAEASGGFLGLFGSKISQEEAAILAVIAQTFGLLDAIGEGAAAAPHAYDELTEVPDNLYPVLKASEWAESAKGKVVMRSVYGNDAIEPGEPVVAYAIDTPTSVQFVNRDQLGDSLSEDALHEGAIANLERRLSTEGGWGTIEHDLSAHGFGVVSGVVCCGDFYCAEGMLSKTVLEQAHEKLDSALLMVTVPERGKLFATHLVSQEQPEPEKLAFMAFAVKHFFNAHDAPIAPTVWISRTGKVVGHVAGMDGIVKMAERMARTELEDEASKLVYEASKTSEEGPFGVRLDVVAKDIDIMMKQLQHVIREFADKARRDDAFNWQIHVNLSIEDPDYDASSEPQLRATMDDMFAFLTEQLRTVMGGAGEQVELTYTLAS